MIGQSRLVSTNQRGCHPRLAEVVNRHLTTPWRQPIRQYSRDAFAAWRSHARRPLVLDVGCGSGSPVVAEQFGKEYAIVGVDRSSHRLQRQQVGSAVQFYRADLADWWRLQAQAYVPCRYQFWFYPNPYPKAAQLQRRWYAHPVFPAILAVGGQLECRSNWWLYLAELQYALSLVGITACISAVANNTPIVSLFEKKYRASAHPLYRLQANLNDHKIPSKHLDYLLNRTISL